MNAQRKVKRAGFAYIATAVCMALISAFYVAIVNAYFGGLSADSMRAAGVLIVILFPPAVVAGFAVWFAIMGMHMRINPIAYRYSDMV